MRGEHRRILRLVCITMGSSPHARGAPKFNLADSAPGGIIPACAGSTRTRRPSRRRSRDHPRMRGEHLSMTRTAFRLGGSSPHARGAHTVEVIDERLGGSSPHARGAPDLLAVNRGVDGIIPACAGSTKCYPPFCYAVRDHPRMRGEHLVARLPMLSTRGSSPHARGAPDQCITSCMPFGIIPACAGSTTAFSASTPKSRDHPRMRGEHDKGEADPGIDMGSSPHARGAQPVDLRAVGEVGIIPACAGSTMR